MGFICFYFDTIRGYLGLGIDTEDLCFIALLFIGFLLFELFNWFDLELFNDVGLFLLEVD